MDASSECPCHGCAADADEAMRARHRRVRALAAYVPAEQRAFFASQLDQAPALGRGDDVLAATVCGVDAAAVRRHREVEGEFAGNSERMLEQLGADAATRALLAQAWAHRHEWAEDVSTATRDTLDLALRVHGVRIRVSCPASMESFLLLFEVFLAEPYRVHVPAPVIHDLGANIGLSALYFHALFPGIPIVCVEPLADNVRFLEENLRRNGVNGRIEQVAVGLRDGTAEMSVPPAMPSLSSVVPGMTERFAREARRVPQRSFQSLVDGDGYGLKLDIEGAEHALVHAPAVIERARWIVGEIHAGPSIVELAHADDLLHLLRRHFTVDVEGPGVFGDSVTWTFRATRHGDGA